MGDGQAGLGHPSWREGGWVGQARTAASTRSVAGCLGELNGGTQYSPQKTRMLTVETPREVP